MARRSAVQQEQQAAEVQAAAIAQEPGCLAQASRAVAGIHRGGGVCPHSERAGGSGSSISIRSGTHPPTHHPVHQRMKQGQSH